MANGHGPLLLPIDSNISTSNGNNITNDWELIDMSYILKSIYMIWCRPVPWESDAQLAVVAGPDEDTASMPPRVETPNVR